MAEGDPNAGPAAGGAVSENGGDLENDIPVGKGFFLSWNFSGLPLTLLA